MPSDRDLALQWLTSRLEAVDSDDRPEEIAAAILDTPGVEVVPIYHPLDNAYRMVIRLPIGAVPRSGVAAHQHTEKINEEER
jgi:hypothetical protein